MPLDHYMTLGRSGLKVSRFCLGAMTFGTEWGFGSEADEATRILDAYADRGGISSTPPISIPAAAANGSSATGSPPIQPAVIAW